MSFPITRRRFVSRSLLAAGAVALAARAAERLSLAQVTVAGCSLPNHSFEQMLEKVAALGFAGVELAVFAEDPKPNVPDLYPWAVVDRLTDEEKVRLRALVSQFSLVSTHLPYSPRIRPIAEDAEIRAASRKELFRALDDSAFWGAKVANVHVLPEGALPFATVKPRLIALYRELGDYAGSKGMKLAIETTRPYSAAQYLELVHDVAHANVGGTVDTGHIHFFEEELSVELPLRSTPDAIRQYNDLLLDIVTKLGPKLFHLHLDDVRPLDWREHFVPGTGIIDWERLFTHLAQVKYSAALVLELLYYVGADDKLADRKRAFAHQTQPSESEAGLKAARQRIEQAIAATRG